MVSIITSVYDLVSEKYSSPQLSINEATALRDFKYACEHIPNIPNEDIQLEKIGEFDDVTGTVSPVQHKIICKGSVFLKVGELDGREEVKSV